MDDRKYRCLTCGWIGLQNELEYDSIETCMGKDETEMCPICGSLEVAEIFVMPKK